MRRFLASISTLALVAGLVPHASVSAAPPPQDVTVRVISSDGSVRNSFAVPSANRAGGMSVSVADLGSDGVPEIILGNGLGNEPRVRVYREDGSEIGSFLAYDGSMGVGVNVAACDLDGDGTREIVTVPMRGGSPHVRVFDNFGTLVDPGFFAYAESMAEGVNLACGDLDGDDADELVTLPAPGGGPHVRVWSRAGKTLALANDFFAFDATDTRGLVGVVRDETLTVATQRGETSDEKTYVIHSLATKTETARVVSTGMRGITSAFARDGRATFATSQDATIVGDDGVMPAAVESATGSVAASAGDFDGDGADELVTVESKPAFGTGNAAKSIRVDISEQRLYAYENGLVDNTFLVSTARSPWQTPVGEHAIIGKVPLVHYAGGSGADAYDLGWVPYNLRFYPHVYIHYAPWHNNFGSPMSHGCVNVSLENMKWIYDWSDVGIPVTVEP